MPFSKITFKPGVNKENTRYFNEGGWYESQWVRFRQGTPEKIGGWTQYSANKFLGVCRSLWNWITLSNLNLVGVGTNLKYYLTYGTSYFDITPIRATNVVSGPFAAVTTTPFSSIITVTITAHGALINDFVTFSGATGLGGNMTAAVLNQQYQILSTPNNNTFTISAVNPTTGAAVVSTASDTGTGGTVTAAFQVNTGPATQTPFNGWGAGAWGLGTWGNGQVVKNNLQIWNAYNFGENLIFGPRGAGIYYWTASSGVSSRGVNLNSIGGAVTVTNSSSTGLAAVITSTVTLPNNSSIQLNATSMPAGLTANVTYYVVNVLGTAFNLSATQGGTPISTTSTGTGVYISNLVDVPIYQNYLQVSDSSNFVIVFGTNSYGSAVLDPMLIRWSDQQNPTVWYPDITNQAGSVRLSHGSQIVTAIQTRQEIFVLTDAASYSLQYLGPPYVWGVQLLGENTTIIGPNAATIASGVVYWMGVDKFYIYGGGAIQTLNCDLRRYVFQNINYNQNQQVYCSTVEGYNEIWWFYVSGSGEQVNSYVVYNYLEHTWYYGSIGRTAWLDTTLQTNPIGATYNGYLCNQESGVDDNETGTIQPIDAFISSSEFDIADGDHFFFVDRILPDLTFSGSSNSPTPATTMTLIALTDSGSGATQSKSNNVNYTAAYNITEEFTGQVYTRIRGRQMIFKMESNQIGTTWQLGAPRFNVRPDGRR
jgi:hypothetical protein